jgi:hypothetical protein
MYGDKSFHLGADEIAISKDVFETILKDIYATHKAEMDIIKLELSVYKRAIAKSTAKIKDQKLYINKLSDTLMTHIMQKEEVGTVKKENNLLRSAKEGLEKKVMEMTRVMARFDIENL